MRKSVGRHRALITTLLLAVSSVAATAQAPLNLFNGTSLLGWNKTGNWTGAGGMLTTSGGGIRHVLTAVPFGDFSLEFEYTETANADAKFRMWSSREGTGGLAIDLDFSGSKSGVGGIEVVGRSNMASVSSGWHRVQVEASHGRVTVRVDGQSAGSSSADLGARAGYIGFEASAEGQFSARNLRLRPLNLNSIFNGSDLGDWKSVPRPPESKGGMGHTTEKVFTFGMGGGSTKPHEARWAAKGGSIHGEAGPGALENSTPLEDGIIQITSKVGGDVKSDNFTSLAIRNTPGQFAAGYAVGIGPYAGTVDRLNKAPFGKSNTPVDQTIAFGGRVIETWVNGNISSVVTDPRPEGANAQAGSRVQGGSTMLVLPNDHPNVDVSRVSLIGLGKPYGTSPRAPAPPPVATTVTTPATVTATGGGGDSAAADALKRAADKEAQKEAEDQRRKDQVSSLMTQALGSSDPQQQKDLYGQVMQLDPSNPNAMAGYKEAQTRLAEQQNANAKVANAQQDQRSKEEQTNSALVTAQSAFLGGRVSEASNALSIAERLSPNNPAVRELRSRISAVQAQHSRLLMLGSGAGLIALLAGLLAWLRRRKQKRYPVLEVTSGIDAGRTFRIEKDQTRIGAVPQDGGQKNDIVVRDVEHAISRFHCEIVKRNGQLFLQDLNSSNGTRVDGERLKPQQAALLRRGTRIELAGTVELRFGYSSSAQAGTDKA